MTQIERLVAVYVTNGRAWWNSKKKVPCVSVKGENWKRIKWVQDGWGGYIYNNTDHAHWVLMGPSALNLAKTLYHFLGPEQQVYVEELFTRAKAEGLDVPELV